MSLTSLSTDYVLFLESIQRNLYRFGGPILMIIDSVICILSFIVFIKKNLRKNPCSIHFEALSISRLLFIYSSVFFNMLLVGYDINPIAYNIIVCRYSIYAPFVFESLSSSYLFFASIDRILITSSNAQI